MAHQGSFIAATVTAVVLGTASSAVAMESGAQPTAVVRVDNQAGVSAGNLRVAEERTTEVFRRIGIRVTWLDGETATQEKVAGSYTVVVMAAKLGQEDGRQPRWVDIELGVAAPVARRAHVFYDRVMAMGARSQRAIGSILGDVIAHELGHLLLPPPSHSVKGIMRPNVSFEWPIQTFEEAQAEHIRSRLQQAL